MKKQYTKKQIVEAINYWKKQLRAGNYKKLNESNDGYKYCLYYESYGNDDTVQIFDSMEELDKSFKEFLDGYFSTESWVESGDIPNVTFKDKTHIELELPIDPDDDDPLNYYHGNKKLPPELPSREPTINKVFDLWKKYHEASFGVYDERYSVFIIRDSKLPELMSYLDKFDDNAATNAFYDIKNELYIKHEYKHDFRKKIIPKLCADGGKYY